MTDLSKILQQGPDDVRFQFDVIKQLAESVREMSSTQVKMLERLARIEEQRTHEVVRGLTERVTVLEVDLNKRTGMMNAIGALPKIIAFLVALASVFSAIYLAGRAAGIVPAPPARIEAKVDPQTGKLEGMTGGKP